MKMFLKQLPATAAVFLLVTLPAFVNAAADATATITGGLTATNAEAGLPGGGNGALTLPVLVGRLIQALLGVIGIIFLVYIVYAGFLYMTDGGEGGKVKKAKAMIAHSIIGIVIIIAAYALTAFVITTLGKAVSATTPG
ncbi:MAG: hypothetical protein AAB403_14210 [Planctomycetota bacterium]